VRDALLGQRLPWERLQAAAGEKGQPHRKRSVAAPAGPNCCWCAGERPPAALHGR
jgi:hypothetical protein